MDVEGGQTTGGEITGPDAKLLADIEGLQLTARTVAQGALAGVHRSLRRGSSIEFSEHKVYTPGDDVRHIDWRAFAKTDRFHIKQFEDETNLRLEILIDHSGSMGFHTPGHLPKLDYARVLAAALGYLALRQGDATGLFAFAHDVTDELPGRASSAHLVELLSRLSRLRPQGATGVTRCVDIFAQTRRRRALVVLLSDLFDPVEQIDAFRRLTARGHDVSVLHLLDPAELTLPYDTPVLFRSMEDTRRLFVHPRTLRHAYIREMQRFLRNTARQMSEAGVLYRQITTDVPPATVLGELLRQRH